MAGMMTRLALASALLLGMAVSAMAQEGYVEPQIDQTKLYVSDPAACKALEEQGVDAFGELDFLTLTFDRGIEGMEFNCRFFDVKSQKGNRFLFVDAVCEAPGEVYPDTLSISPWDETSIQVVSTYDSMMVMSGNLEPAGPTTNPGVTNYTRCDNLSEIPVD